MDSLIFVFFIASLSLIFALVGIICSIYMSLRVRQLSTLEARVDENTRLRLKIEGIDLTKTLQMRPNRSEVQSMINQTVNEALAIEDNPRLPEAISFDQAAELFREIV